LSRDFSLYCSVAFPRQTMDSDGQNGGARRVQFGVFEVDRSSGELRRSGVKVRIQSQPFKLLTILLDQPGEVVSRETLQLQLWGGATTVDFDHSLGIAVNKLREALGDSAENPRFVETLARRGYRFIAPVKSLDPEPVVLGDGKAGLAVEIGVQTERRTAGVRGIFLEMRLQILWLSVGLILAGMVIGLFLLIRPAAHRPYQISQVTYSGHVLSNDPDVEGFSSSAGDGTRLYFSHIENGNPVLAVALVANGEISHFPLPAEIGAPLIGSLSPDGSKLVVHGHLQALPEQPLWIVPTLGGNTHRVPKVLAHDATWMPGGLSLLIATGSDLVVVGEDGSGSHKFLTVPGLAFWLRWSPDGRRLRFTLQDPKRQTTELWEVASDGSNPHPLLAGWNHPTAECCGNWTADGAEYVFQSTRSGHSDLWALHERAWFLTRAQPRRITNGPLDFEAPSTAPGGHRIYFIGVNSQIELLQAQPPENGAGNRNRAPNRPGDFNALAPNLNMASLVEYSRDGQWVAWLDGADGYLWRSRIDGSERIQLTTPPLRIFSIKWSPDNKRVALMAEEPGRPWKIYLIDSDGGQLTPLINQDKNEEDRNEADPNWSADGNTLVFGRLPDRMDSETSPKAIYLMDIATHKVTEVPGSVGLFSPRLSPDGRYIVAIRLDQSALLLYDRTTQHWSTISTHGAGDPIWSHDGQYVYFQDFLQPGKPIFRIAIPDGHVEQVAAVDNQRPVLASDYRLLSLAPGDLPVVSARTSTVNLYTIDLNER
jgi:Tol biopolymer transport system component/DNA-binding winged helix-turn-helix (wHTH) protein